MWTNLLRGAAVASLFLTSLAPAVSAGPPCEDRGKLVAQLAQKYQETSVAIGVASNGVGARSTARSRVMGWAIVPSGRSSMRS